jgi:PAT family beta-lactamase induction signal transducer AmpG
VITQLALAGALFIMADTSPAAATRAFAMLAVAVAFLSASQDVVIDAYRTDLLHSAERGLGSSVSVLGYRLAMIVSGGIVMIWTDPSNAVDGAGWTWPQVYRLMAGLMVAAAVLSMTILPRLQGAPKPSTVASRDLLGFAAVVMAVVVGVVLSNRYAKPVAQWALEGALAGTSLSPALQAKWIDLAALMLGLALTLPMAAGMARAARFETLLGGLRSYFAQPGAGGFLAFIVLYKLGDAFAGSLMTPFLLQAMQFSPAEFGVVNKLIGMWLTIGGALLGGVLMLKLGLWRSLMLFGVLQLVSNLGFWWLAVNGKGVLPGFTVPAFDWYFVWLHQATRVDGGLIMVIAFENLSGGMGTAALVAFLMSLCNHRFTATQFALLSAFASVGRVWVGPLAGVLAETIGWPSFFVVATATAAPGLALLWWLKPQVQALEVEPDPQAAPA